ncbi:aldehyde dehydrogenase [Limnoraphis robusta]|uniref:Aldehyde dehydrogenase n=1 Tax=Limnoraphis robusta CCNP1315 TaxID=3110306 RepID=A0ABU5TSZ8_9CYAN|nr:aldehyde dehydrogenase [Limnoraphis robusta]MEA5499677.1 aldehyde dehydrogenase [Limnoraphis robusta BA-68 BA1]MEA5517827.1 aldehyde dehydrogenase [Limnoraphis robusta CCNP1315]MEA5546367.1 aldehyde dehydrogenase [Limnoraphis robusta CCNP1324]
MPESLQVETLIQQQRQFFATGQTKNVNFRREQLQRLKQAIIDHQGDIIAGVKADLNRPEFEAYFEIASVSEVNYAIKHLKSWTKPKKVPTSIDQFPASAQIFPEPLGVVLIIGPWNYPFQLMISPLVGAIAAGNCAILKPSEIAANTSKVVAKMIQKTFDPAYVAAVEGGVETSQALLAQKFDHIFFTGGTKIGKIVMEAAAKHLTPVTLELGGKSPCIVESDVQLDYTAKRIAWGKFLNAGQTCIAPDYLLVHRQIKTPLLEKIKQNIQEFYGENPEKSPDYCRIISPRQFERLAGFLQNAKVIVGGQTNPEDHYIAPTLLDQVSWDDPVMQEEIFGPILPVLEYNDLGEAIAQINSRPKPLALYFFSKDQAKQQQVLQNTSSGGVCLNDTVLQFSGTYLPFGGVGESGMGSYHGKASFDTFSHYKSILINNFLIDIKLRYAPYQGKIDLIKKIILGL